MRLLLDTHVWLWSRGAPQRLSARMQDAIAEAANELFLSPLSVWEAAWLNRKGRIHLAAPWEEWLGTAWDSGGYREAAASLAVVRAANGVALRHGDPIDWLLAATARHYGLTLVTADAALLGGSGYAVQPAN